MPSHSTVVAGALFFISSRSRAEKIYFAIVTGFFLVLQIGIWGIWLSTTWRFEFRLEREPSGLVNLTYRTWTGGGFLPTESLTVSGVKAIRSIEDGPSRRPMIRIDTSAGVHDIELPSRWRTHSYDTAYFVNQMLARPAASGTHSEQMDNASYGFLALSGLFGTIALIFAGMGFRVDSLILDRDRRTIVREFKLFKSTWRRRASWNEVRGVRGSHVRQKGDHYFLTVEFNERRRWKLSVDATNLAEVEAFAGSIREYLAGAHARS